MNSKRIASKRYAVTVNKILYCVYQSNGLWWAKNQSTLKVVDAATNKAQLLRSLEAS